jgi:glyoxylase-like metal-dependent hydrolase (beta-lactamase superfamily II)
MRMEKVADGVWLLRGDLGNSMNVYFIEDGDGVVQFDAGTKTMSKKVRAAGEELGGIKKVVLGHGHADHRGSAPYVDAPVFCHPDEVADAESEAAIDSYMEISELPALRARLAYPLLLRKWDGGAVGIDGTVAEGDRVAGFEVVDFPGHAHGLIGLWRESDRVALVSDVIYLIDSVKLGKPLPPGEASVPHPAWAWNHAKAKESVRKLAALDPAIVGTGHAEPLEAESLRETLERAAEKY